MTSRNNWIRSKVVYLNKHFRCAPRDIFLPARVCQHVCVRVHAHARLQARDDAARFPRVRGLRFRFRSSPCSAELREEALTNVTLVWITLVWKPPPLPMYGSLLLCPYMGDQCDFHVTLTGIC
jgi:hypothetical protein